MSCRECDTDTLLVFEWRGCMLVWTRLGTVVSEPPSRELCLAVGRLMEMPGDRGARIEGECANDCVTWYWNAAYGADVVHSEHARLWSDDVDRAVGLLYDTIRP